MTEYVNECTLVDKINTWYDKRKDNMPLFIYGAIGVIFCIEVLADLRSVGNSLLLESSILLLELGFFVYVCKKLFFTRGVVE